MTFTSAQTLATLKDFQRQTVEHVFSRLFGQEDSSRRFLVADEVGLGKTLIAKGVVARTIERLQHQGQVNIIYVCSNQDVASQNIKRLAVKGLLGYAEGPRLATRLTLLPLHLKNLESTDGKLRVSFVSFTPGTSFSPGNRSGRQDERRLIYHMLKGCSSLNAKGLFYLMCGRNSREHWMTFAGKLDTNDIDESIAREFIEAVEGDGDLRQILQAACDFAADLRRKETDLHSETRLSVTAKLRQVLARICLRRLSPNLIILDEFQRFSELLQDPEKSEAAELAHDLFTHSRESRILLLSATPYRMYSAGEGKEDHYAEFLKMLQFLMPGGDNALQVLGERLREFRSMLLDLWQGKKSGRLNQLKREIEDVLRTVMCRSERVGRTSTLDAMVRERPLEPVLEPADLKDYVALSNVARALDQPEIVEYWKSSPYLLNFMKEYDFKRSFALGVAKPKADVLAFLGARGSRLNHQKIGKFGKIDPANPRLRALVQELAEHRFFDLVWVPPSAPYWQPEAHYAQAAGISKQLVFSAWNVVPEALSALLSYEAERHVFSSHKPRLKYEGLSRRLRGRLVFTRKEGRLAGMLNLLLVFPSPQLARLVDPAMRAAGAEPTTYAKIRVEVAARLQETLTPVMRKSPLDGAVDPQWYWVALAYLERQSGDVMLDWCKDGWYEATHESSGDDEDSGKSTSSEPSLFNLHVEHWADALEVDVSDLGKIPDDLCMVLADIALCAPGTCALRSLSRIDRWTGEAPSPELLSAAFDIAWGLRSQFNSARVIGLIDQGDDDGSFWQKVLGHCRDGNLQSVLDEYLHCLRESVTPTKDQSLVEAITMEAYKAATLRTVSVYPDSIEAEGEGISVSPMRPGLRSHFAVRFDSKSEDAKAGARKDAVKAAFNSPFAPFVLASTSVGQEGLDFHFWCHSVIHWNLPSNPVDLEQREGRVHRYKGLAVRRNVASTHVPEALGGLVAHEDVWEKLFSLAAASRKSGDNEMVPYWIYDRPGGAKIERRVAALPYSRDVERYEALRRNLAIYRLAFAQPRQDDLLACLAVEQDGPLSPEELAMWRIDLSPPAFEPRPIEDLDQNAGALQPGVSHLKVLPYVSPDAVK